RPRSIRVSIVIQPTGDVITTEGETVTLGCTFETSDKFPYLFWYKQEVNDFPKYMLKRYSTSDENAPDFQKNRFDATINKTSVPLKIQKLQLSDSAVYYCALRSTVTGNTKTLYKNLWSKDNIILHNIQRTSWFYYFLKMNVNCSLVQKSLNSRTVFVQSNNVQLTFSTVFSSQPHEQC
uniref:Ig-like domain-containing protein n=1 Tax=Sander lucioperca TaxID=283035 RepID=A0A8C9Z4R9_SANLU